MKLDIAAVNEAKLLLDLIPAVYARSPKEVRSPMKRRFITALTLMIGVWLASAPLAQESIQIGGPIFQGLDNNGDPCDGCKLYVFISGTQTAASTYTTRAHNTSHTSPVVLDAAGRAVVFVDASGIYDLRLDAPDDVTIWTMLGAGQPVQDASGLRSTAGVDVALDTDNNTTNAAFRVLNGFGSAVFSVSEAGVFSPALFNTLGCTGRRGADTVLYGDCTWAEIPTQYVMALGGGTSSATASSFATVGETLTFPATTDDVSLLLIGVLSYTIQTGGTTAMLDAACRIQVINTTTNTTFSTPVATVPRQTSSGLVANIVFSAHEIIDSSPMENSDNVYAVQIRRSDASRANTCTWASTDHSLTYLRGRRGLIAFG